MTECFGETAFCSLIQSVFISALKRRTVNSFYLLAGAGLTHREKLFCQKKQTKQNLLFGRATVVINCTKEEFVTFAEMFDWRQRVTEPSSDETLISDWNFCF